MAMLGGLDASRRRLAWVDGVMAAGWGAASLFDSRDPSHQLLEG